MANKSKRNKRKNAKRQRRPNAPSSAANPPATHLWREGEGNDVHAMVPAVGSKQETLDQLSKAYQEQLRNSPLWDEMILQFGPEKAEELLLQCRAESRP